MIEFAGSEKKFTSYLLSPHESKNAYGQAANYFKAGHGPISYYEFQCGSELKQVELFYLEKPTQSQVFVIDKNKVLGKGAQGTVYLAQEVFPDHQSNDLASLSVAKISQENRSSEQDFKSEAAILERLDRLKGFSTFRLGTTVSHYLFSDYCDGSNLIDILYRKPFNRYIKNDLDPLTKVRLLKAVMLKVQNLHQTHGILHRDLKTENIIIQFQQDKVIAHLVDFGTSCLMQRANKSFLGTIGYQAPETVLPNEKRALYNVQTEYFSLGVILAEILSSQNYQHFLASTMKKNQLNEELSFISSEEIKQAMNDVFRIDKEKTTGDYELPERIYSMIQSLTHQNPLTRPQFNHLNKMISQLEAIELDLMQQLVKTPRSAREWRPHEIDSSGDQTKRADSLSHQFEHLSLNSSKSKSNPKTEPLLIKQQRKRAPSVSPKNQQTWQLRQRSFSSSVPKLDTKNIHEKYPNECSTNPTSPTRKSFPFSPRGLTSSLKIFSSPRKSPKKKPDEESSCVEKTSERKRKSFSKK